MITLKDISLREYIDEGIKSAHIFPQQCKYAILLKEYGVYDCESLYLQVKSGNLDFQDERFKEILSYASLTIKSLNKKVLHPEIYKFEAYDKYPEFRDVLKETDRYVRCSELPIFSPLEITGATIKSGLASCTIEKAKTYLGEIGADGRNLLTNQMTYLRLETLPSIVEGINFYEEQLLRVAMSTGITRIEPNKNLFLLDFEAKYELVLANLEDIIFYLINNGDTFIFGKMGDTYKKRLLSCLDSDTKSRRKVRENIAETIAKYVTLEELQRGVVENGTLKRFIMEPKKK